MKHDRSEKRQLEDFFRDELRLSVADAPSFDELAAYIEGRLDPEARALLEERMAADATLRQEVEDLRALHAQMARPRRAPIRSLPLRLAMLAAAAAVAAVAVTSWNRPSRDTARPDRPVVTPFQVRIPVLKDVDVSSLDPGMRDAVDAALRGVLPTPTGLESLQAPRATLMGTGPIAAFALQSPLGTRVGTDRPTFRWTPHPGARSYEVAVFDTDLRKQLASGPVAGTEWTAAPALPRGRTYVWQVTALAGGERITAPAPPAPEARFEVASLDVLADVEKRRAAAPASPLVATIAFVQAGLLDDAEAQLRTLAVANPGSPEVKRLREALSTLRAVRSKDSR